MRNRSISTPDRFLTPRQAAGLVRQAIENERCLDLRFRATRSELFQAGDVPNFKVMKQLALRRRFGYLYPVLVLASPFVVVLLAPLQWIGALFGSCIGRGVEDAPRHCRILATTLQNSSLIDAALNCDDDIARLSRRRLSLAPASLGRELEFRLVIASVGEHLLFLLRLLAAPVGVRRDLILHSWDSFPLLLLALSASRSGDMHVTDDHYQRWSYLLSHAVRDFRIVQHGFLDAGIEFPNAFGSVRTVYLRDESFRALFETFFRVQDAKLFSPTASFVETPLSTSPLLLASSFPAVDEEIELLAEVRRRLDVPVIVKFHPAHQYDQRKAILASLATMVFEGEGNPLCRIFVSHGSFMEFDYKNRGIPTVSIARAGSAAQAFAEIAAQLKIKGPLVAFSDQH